MAAPISGCAMATGETIGWIYTDGWLAEVLDGGTPDD
jgi:hypothetical protein